MAQLKLHFLGELQVVRDGAEVELPPSKKTRGLLAYLALNNKSFRREQLCELLWEIPDDPRGSLRWSLSKLRRLVDEEHKTRIVANRTSVSLNAVDVDIDVTSLHGLVKTGPETQSTANLQAAAARYRGNFLEGLELPNVPQFYTWCVAEREHAIRSQATLLRTLIDRLASQADQALEYAHMLAGILPYDETARAALIKLLVTLGRGQEAEQQYQLGMRMLEEVGAEDLGVLQEARRGPPGSQSTAGSKVNHEFLVKTSLLAKTSTLAKPTPAVNTSPAAQNTVITTPHVPLRGKSSNPLFGRDEELQCLTQTFELVTRDRLARFMLIRGEPGIGKSRLLEVVAELAQELDTTLLRADAFESEVIRPFGVWNDAFRRASSLNTPKLLSSDERIDRDQLFGNLSERVTKETNKRPVIIIIDDVQWCDESSAAALHYVMRMNREQPFLVVAAARETELRDNMAMQLVIRGLRHDHLYQELKIGPLAQAALCELIAIYALQADCQRLSEESGGNPLLAIELARAESEGDSGGSLSELIQERMSRLDVDATEVLRWAAVLAPHINVASLERVTGLDHSLLETALEIVEQQGILQPSDSGFRFSHDLVAQIVYADISPARRQVMHRRVAEFLEVDTALDLQLAADLAHHASQSGDQGLAARAMVFAGRLCLRFYANEEALSLADKGLQFAEKLSDADRVCLTLELCEIKLTAAPLDDWESAATTYVALAEQALDHGVLPHARLGYQMASYVRWVHGQWSDAQRDSLQAERVTRAGSDEDHIIGMAETAKCLALLERDLSHADAMLMETRSLAARQQMHCAAIPAALGILRYYENNLGEAEELLQEARTLFKSQGERVNEFQANEYLIMIDIERGAFDAALRHCKQLIDIGQKLREGSEEPFARALEALCSYAITGEDRNLDVCLESLRQADAKQRLTYILTRAALLDIDLGVTQSAQKRACEALDYAELLDRNSDKMLAHLVMAQVMRTKASQSADDSNRYKQHLDAMAELTKTTVAKWARDKAAPLLTDAN